MSLVRSFTASSSASGTAVSVTITTSPAAQDLLAFFVAADSNTTISTPTGWTLMVSSSTASGSVAIFTKIADGTETSVASTLGTTGNWNSHYGQYNSTPSTFAAVGAQADKTVSQTNASSTSLTPGVTAATTLDSWLALICLHYAGTNQVPTWSPAGYLTLANTSSTGTVVSGLSGYRFGSAAGTGTKNGTATVTTAVTSVGCMVLLPEPGTQPRPKAKTTSAAISSALR